MVTKSQPIEIVLSEAWPHSSKSFYLRRKVASYLGANTTSSLQNGEKRIGSKQVKDVVAFDTKDKGLGLKHNDKCTSEDDYVHECVDIAICLKINYQHCLINIEMK